MRGGDCPESLLCGIRRKSFQMQSGYREVRTEKSTKPKPKIIIIYNLSTPRSSEPSRPYCVSGSSHQPPLLLLPSRSVSCAAIPATGAEPAPAEVSCHLLITDPAARPAHAAAPAPASDPAALGPAPAAALRVSFPGPQLPRAAYTDQPHFIATCFICTLQRLRFFVCLFFVFLFFVFYFFYKLQVCGKHQQKDYNSPEAHTTVSIF